MKRVCHFSSAHTGLDVRIFHKESASLASAGYDVHMVMAGSVKEKKLAKLIKVQLHSLKLPKKRLQRILFHSWVVFFKALQIKAGVYHFHDPELIPHGIILSLLRKKVIYDVHEDTPADILQKYWIPKNLRIIVAKIVEMLEFLGGKFFFSIIVATPFLKNKFKSKKISAIDIKNYPLRGEFPIIKKTHKDERSVCYVGELSPDRGIFELCEAMQKTHYIKKLYLVGRFCDQAFESQILNMPTRKKICILGYLDRRNVGLILNRASAGLVTLHPEKNHLNSLPIKMFEYMYAGLPVIASDFPIWRKIIEKADCGILVNPLCSTAIAKAIDSIVLNPKQAREMGYNARKAVENTYSWDKEEKKLLDLYRKLVHKNKP